MKKRAGEELTSAERNIVLPWARGYAKSTSSEMATIAEGCILDEGFVLYLSDSQQLAEEHLYSVKAILENGHFAEYYPKMAKPKVSQTGSQTKFTQDTIICENGWGMTARGITSNVRGGRLGTLRYTLIISDDVDSLNDSLMVIEKKKRILARSVYPAMDPHKGVTIFAQNLITANSVASQIVHRKTDILSERTVVGGGPVKAFKDLELSQATREDGSPYWQIAHAESTWAHFNLENARNFLALSGKEAFLAEYQHEFDERTGKVISNYNEERQVITWSEFEKVFGVKYIPQHWRAACGVDVGYSDGMHPHYSAWTFIAVSSLNSPLPNRHFIYRSRMFKNLSIDDQAIAIWNDLLADSDRPYAEYATDFTAYPPLQQHFGSRKYEAGGVVKHWQISHERTGEMLTLRQKYGLPFGKVQHYKATDGVAQWNHMSAPDRTHKHPFKEDELDNGYWLLGSPNLFYIVEDKQMEIPVDDKGMRLLREQVEGWDWVKTKITETGLTEERPSKINDDGPDTIKSLLVWFGQSGTPLTLEEKRIDRLPEVLRDTPDAPLSEQDKVKRQLWLQREAMREKYNQEPEIFNRKDSNVMDYLDGKF